MKKTLKVLSLLMALMVVFASCKPNLPAPESEDEVESTPEQVISTITDLDDGYTWKTAAGMEYGCSDDWSVTTSGQYTYVEFSTVDNAFVMFMDPTYVGDITLTKDDMKDIIEGFASEAEGDVESSEIVEVTIAGQKGYTVEIETELSGVDAKMAIWCFVYDSEVYFIGYAAEKSVYDKYITDAEYIVGTAKV